MIPRLNSSLYPHTDPSPSPSGRAHVRMTWRRGKNALVFFAPGILMCIVIASTASAQQKDKPRVPPGVDPGGVAVAIIGSGIDYTRPEIAARLARDGEGEIVGWDFTDNDRRPFERCGTRGAPTGYCNETPLGLVTSNKVRIIPLRAQLQNERSLVEAVRFATMAGAKLVFIGLPVPPPSRFIDDAAGFHTTPLFIATVRPDPRKPSFKLAAGDNFIVANATAPADGPEGMAVTMVNLLADAVECAAKANTDAKGIKNCTLGFPAGKP